MLVVPAYPWLLWGGIGDATSASTLEWDDTTEMFWDDGTEIDWDS